MSRDAYIRKAVEGILDDLERDASGGRNNALNVAAVKLGGYVATGDVEYQGAVDALVAAGVALGLEGSECRRTVASGLRHGQRNPARLPADLGEGRRTAHLKSRGQRREFEAHPAPPTDVLDALIAIRDRIEAVKMLEPSRELLAWCGLRSIHPAHVEDFGCVELSGPIATWLSESFDHDVLVSSGWRQKPGGKWTGDPSWVGAREPGLLIPVWSPRFRHAPVGWRFQPWDERLTRVQKRWSMPGGETWRSFPLSRDWVGRSLCVIVEGEPDWLTVGPVMRANGVACIATPGSGWRPAWKHELARFKRVIVATHADEAGRKCAESIAKHCEDLGIPWRVKHPPEGRDWNDMRQAGMTAAEFMELARWTE